MTEVSILRLPMSLPCPVPVLPGTPDTMRDGEPISLEERTEACCVDAFWMIGRQVTCDVHLQDACSILGLDYASLAAEAGVEREERPWAERHRYPQEIADSGREDG